MKLLLDSGVSLPGENALRICVEMFLPHEIPAEPLALVCLAGGNMNRRYYDLRPDGGDDSFSFAAQMTAHGFIVVTMDYLGLGDSDKPADCYALTPDLLTQSCVNASTQALAQLREGALDSSVPAMPKLKSLGVGHSMGAMMTVLHQASARQHAGIALLGFSTRGLPNYLPPEVREMTQAQQRAGLTGFARKMFVQQYPVIRSSGNGAELYGSAKAESKGVTALKAATACLLPVTAFLSMLPNNVAPEAAQIAVPVFLGLGERDMAGPPHEIPAAFPKSLDVRLHILAETGHSHFLFTTRLELFDRLAEWAQSVIRFSK